MHYRKIFQRKNIQRNFGLIIDIRSLKNNKKTFEIRGYLKHLSLKVPSETLGHNLLNHRPNLVAKIRGHSSH